MPPAARYAPLPPGGVLDHTSHGIESSRAQRARDRAQHARDVWRYPATLAQGEDASAVAARGASSLAGRFGATLQAPAGRGAAAFFAWARTYDVGRVQLAEAMWWLHASVPVRRLHRAAASLSLPPAATHVALSAAYLGVALMFLTTGAQVGRLSPGGVRACLLLLSCTSLLYVQQELPLWASVPLLTVGPLAALTPDAVLPDPV